MFRPSLRYIVIVLLFIPLFANSQVKDGVLDLRSRSLSGNSIPLDGSWQFYASHFIDVQNPDAIPLPTIMIPSWWDATSTSAAVHYATFRLTILLSTADLRKELALKMPPVYSSYALWVNGKLIGANGKIGTTKAESIPQWKPQAYAFKAEKDTMEVIIHLSNFYHNRSGINESIYLGEAEPMISKESQTRISGTVLFFSLWVFAFISLSIYFFTKNKDKALTYYACLCIVWSFRSIFSNYYLAVQWFPDIDWSVCVRIEYITLYLSMLFGSLVIGRLFPRDVNETFRNIYVISCLLFTLFTLVTPPLLFTKFVQLYLGLTAILLISILVIITKAYIESRQGLTYLLVCLILAVIMFAYVLFAYQGLFELNPIIFNAGFFLIFLFSGIAMATRLNKMATTYDYDILTLDEFNKEARNRK
jgi:hypothetical protein